MLDLTIQSSNGKTIAEFDLTHLEQRPIRTGPIAMVVRLVPAHPAVELSPRVISSFVLENRFSSFLIG